MHKLENNQEFIGKMQSTNTHASVEGDDTMFRRIMNKRTMNRRTHNFEQSMPATDETFTTNPLLLVGFLWPYAALRCTWYL